MGLSNEHFRVYYDPALGEASPDYARTVMRYLAEARASVGERLGAVPQEAMGVVFYGKAAYLEAHRHRFSFQTVGFFDGRIHVVSAGHPAGELRALLFHEYTHAVFREQTGGDRPYWLNEGLAEISERASLNRRGLTRSERQALRRRIDANAWIPLRRLAPSFSGLGDEDARAAYLESMAAAAWIEARTDPRPARATARPAGRGGDGRRGAHGGARPRHPGHRRRPAARDSRRVSRRRSRDRQRRSPPPRERARALSEEKPEQAPGGRAQRA